MAGTGRQPDEPFKSGSVRWHSHSEHDSGERASGRVLQFGLCPHGGVKSPGDRVGLAATAATTVADSFRKNIARLSLASWHSTAQGTPSSAICIERRDRNQRPNGSKYLEKHPDTGGCRRYVDDKVKDVASTSPLPMSGKCNNSSAYKRHNSR